jgi:hypothetical protein
MFNFWKIFYRCDHAYDRQLLKFVMRLRDITNELNGAVPRPRYFTIHRGDDEPMANPIVQQVADEIDRMKVASDNLTAYVAAEPARQQAAIDAAIGLGATAEQLQPLVDRLAMFQQETADLIAAVPTPPVSPPSP